MVFLIGCRVKVVGSPNIKEVGITGVVVRDLKNSFTIYTNQSESKVILKKNRWFEFNCNGKVFIMSGNALLGNFYTRFNKKLKFLKKLSRKKRRHKLKKKITKEKR